jgi:hypothetical protein
MCGILFVADLIQLPPQKVIFDVRVNFHRLYFRATERRLNGKAFRSEFKQIRGKSMPKVVKAEISDAGIAECRSPSLLKIAQPERVKFFRTRNSRCS